MLTIIYTKQLSAIILNVNFINILIDIAKLGKWYRPVEKRKLSQIRISRDLIQYISYHYNA